MQRQGKILHGLQRYSIRSTVSSDTPPTRDELSKLISDMGISVRTLLRKNVEPYEQLGLMKTNFLMSS